MDHNKRISEIKKYEAKIEDLVKFLQQKRREEASDLPGLTFVVLEDVKKYRKKLKDLKCGLAISERF